MDDLFSGLQDAPQAVSAPCPEPTPAAPVKAAPKPVSATVPLPSMERIAELAQWCKMWPQRAVEVAAEQQELDKSIPELRATLAYLDDFERQALEERAVALGLTPHALAMIEGVRTENKVL